MNAEPGQNRRRHKQSGSGYAGAQNRTDSLAHSSEAHSSSAFRTRVR